MDLGLASRAFIVTGGSRGLGRAVAQTLLAEDARVIISGRTATTVRSAERELGPGTIGVVADNADPATADRLTATAADRFGRLDGALISVGGPPVASVTGESAATDEQWRTSFETVFLGAVRLARTVAANLSEGGSIVLVLSTSVRAPLSGLAISNGLRPGLAMLAKTMADELGPSGIRVNGLLPGRVRTERTAELARAAGADPADQEHRVAASIPLRRYGTPPEFAAAAVFLLSPAASYITGAMLPVDGGATRAL